MRRAQVDVVAGLVEAVAGAAAFLARCIAVSAWRISSPLWPPSLGNSAMPMLQVSVNWLPSMREGRGR